MMWNKTFFGKHFKYSQLNNFSYIFCLGFPILFVLVGISNCQSVCPSPLSISPCTCTNDQIICTGISTDNDLIKVFEFLYNNYTDGQNGDILDWKTVPSNNHQTRFSKEFYLKGLFLRIIPT